MKKIIGFNLMICIVFSMIAMPVLGAENNETFRLNINSQHESSCNIIAYVAHFPETDNAENNNIPQSNAIVVASGMCGDNITWNLDRNGVLTFSGTGDMYDFQGGMFYYEGCSPTHLQNIQSSVCSVVINEGITGIGEYTFLHCQNLKTVNLPKSLTKINKFAFFYVTGLEKVIYNGTPNDWENVIIEDVQTCKTSDELRKVISFASSGGADTNSSSAAIRILINNKILQCEQPPVIVNDRTFVPMRAIFEALGAEVEWDGDTHTATGRKAGKTVSFTVGRNNITVNGETSELDVSTQLINDSTMIPVRAVSEAFNCVVDWDDALKQVKIVF